MDKKIKIFGVPWHLAHQYELSKLPGVEWYWLKQHRRGYDTRSRGDFMVNWVPYYEPGKYDLAVLHLDQQCCEPEVLRVGKGAVYRNLNDVITDIPKIVINHGTPYWPERFTTKELQDMFKELIGNNYMVVNSHRAFEQWGWGKTIIHGIDTKEWWDLPKEPRVVTMISPGGLPKYYDRAFLEATKEQLNTLDIQHCHITVDWLAKDWDDYRDFLGRSLIYFNPTRESPMPRSRTEAMLSGCCVLTTPHQDADRFIKNGYNGFLIKRNPEYVAKLIKWLIDDYHTAIEVGQRGKQTAIKEFSPERYQKEWLEMINFAIDDFHGRDTKDIGYKFLNK